MEVEMTEHEARMVRAGLVRQMVELEEELARVDSAALRAMLTADLEVLRSLHDRLAAPLDARPPRSDSRLARAVPRTTDDAEGPARAVVISGSR
jgi:hypothetical protein